MVAPGENLFRIAKRYGVPLDLLAEANGIADGMRLVVRQPPPVEHGFDAVAQPVPLLADGGVLDADGLAGPETLAQLDAFEEMTPAVAEAAVVQPDEEHFESEPLPEISGGEIIMGSTIPVPEKKSVWGKVKGWFS